MNRPILTEEQPRAQNAKIYSMSCSCNTIIKLEYWELGATDKAGAIVCNNIGNVKLPVWELSDT